MILMILCAFLTVGGGMLAGQGGRYGLGWKAMGGNCGSCGGGALTVGG